MKSKFGLVQKRLIWGNGIETDPDLRIPETGGGIACR